MDGFISSCCCLPLSTSHTTPPWMRSITSCFTMDGGSTGFKCILWEWYRMENSHMVWLETTPWGHFVFTVFKQTGWHMELYGFILVTRPCVLLSLFFHSCASDSHDPLFPPSATHFVTQLDHTRPEILWPTYSLIKDETPPLHLCQIPRAKSSLLLT